MIYATPKGTTVYFKVENADPAVLKKLKLHQDQFSGNELKLSDHRWPAILEAMATGDISLHVYWFREPPPSSSLWYDVNTTTQFKSPKRPPSDAAIAFMQDDSRMVVSDRFCRTVRDNKLAGASFLPLESPTPPGEEQWHEIFATHPLGRGIDHPLLDSKLFDKEARKHLAEAVLAKRRQGEQRFERDKFRRDVGYTDKVFSALINDPCASTCQLFGTDSASCAHFAIEYLPKTDFAFAGWHTYGPDDEPMLPRTRFLACSHRAREALLAAGLMKAANFTPYVLYSEKKAQGTVLDREIHEALPPPAYTPAEAAAERTRRLAAHAARPAAVARRAPKTIESMIDLLQASAKQHGWKPVQATPLLKKVAKSKLHNLLPANWLALLPHVPAKIANQSDDSPVPSCEIATPAWNTTTADKDSRSAASRPSTRDLILAESVFGDWFSVRLTNDKPPRDAKVTFWDHETLIAVHTWPTVIAFAFDLMLSAEQAAASRRGS